VELLLFLVNVYTNPEATPVLGGVPIGHPTQRTSPLLEMATETRDCVTEFKETPITFHVVINEPTV